MPDRASSRQSPAEGMPDEVDAAKRQLSKRLVQPVGLTGASPIGRTCTPQARVVQGIEGICNAGSGETPARRPLPGIILGSGLATRENLVEAVQMLRRQTELHSRQGTVQLVTGSRTDDRCGDRGSGEQPG